MSPNSEVSKDAQRERTAPSSNSNFSGSTVHEGVFNPQRRSELLLSKSNYQLLIDGESSQAGISFPPGILESLSRKRSSGIIAERARRKNMNKALGQLAILLSQDCCDEASRNAYAYAVSSTGKYAKDQAKTNLTKVCTVELAIEYIACLQKEVDRAKSSLKGISSKGGSASSEAVTKVQFSV